MTVHAIIAGSDVNGIGDALAAEGASITRIPDVVSTATLESAGIADASILVFTDVSEATGISVAKELNAEVRVVVYADESLPEFARGQADLAVDPELLSPAIVAEELLGTA